MSNKTLSNMKAKVEKGETGANIHASDGQIKNVQAALKERAHSVGQKRKRNTISAEAE